MAVVIGLGQQQNFGAIGSQYGKENALQLGSGLNFVLPRGIWMVLSSANDLVEYTPDSGVTFRTIEAASNGALVFSDGFNTRIRNTGAADVGAVKTFYTEVLIVPGI